MIIVMLLPGLQLSAVVFSPFCICCICGGEYCDFGSKLWESGTSAVDLRVKIHCNLILL